MEPKKSVSADDLYRRSSQYQMWSYTFDTLEQARIDANEKGRAHATEKFQLSLVKSQQDNPDVFTKHPDAFKMDSLVPLLTLEEEKKYFQYYCKVLLDTGKFFNMPSQVKATAMSFFKKFYLVHSAMEFHPKNILYTVLFLAAKSENYFISIESFCKAMSKVQPKDILDLEFVVLQSLKFTLMVHHPFRPLYGFFLDFQQILLHSEPVVYDVSIDKLGSLYDRAKKWLMDYAVLSDVWFLFTPPQIALAAMYDTDKNITEKYLKRKFLPEKEKKPEQLDVIPEEPERNQPKETESEPPAPKKSEWQQKKENYDTLVKTIEKCVLLAKQLPETSKEESVEIDRKCFFSLNPARAIKKKVKQLS